MSAPSGQDRDVSATPALGTVVLEKVFPALDGALGIVDPEASPAEVRRAALILLYRLLYIHHVEDRAPGPVLGSDVHGHAPWHQVRAEVGRRMDEGDCIAADSHRYWRILSDLCRAIYTGDASIRQPRYQGMLFDPEFAPLLSRVRVGDDVMSSVVYALSYEQTDQGRGSLNYRNIRVQQLGSIYEQLLARGFVGDEVGAGARANPFARKDSGSFYTPDDLVTLVVRETVGPLVDAQRDKFAAEVDAVADAQSPDRRLQRLQQHDPAMGILQLKICDPAMGSGHFLVTLVDYLAERVIEAMAEAESLVEGYRSPVAARIFEVRQALEASAKEQGGASHSAPLNDWHIVRRMVLRRSIYGADKDPFAVELAKVSLWLHTYMLGAPHVFVDHHLKCGDSLFGTSIRTAMERGEVHKVLFGRESLRRAARVAARTHSMEGVGDASDEEVRQSAEAFAQASSMTRPLDAFMSLLHAFDWLDPKKKEVADTYQAWLSGAHGDPIDVAVNGLLASSDRYPILTAAQDLATQERFLNWQVAFPDVWSSGESAESVGGFDAMVGNPPWDRIKLQQVEWFAARRPEIAAAPRAADRKRMSNALVDAGDPLAEEFRLASERARMAARVVRESGDYPLLGRGDLNLYQLFVERAMALVKPTGMVGLIIPTGIASDKAKAPFFKALATEGRLKVLFDFKNQREFFPDIHPSFKFCVFVASRRPLDEAAKCAFYLRTVAETNDPDRVFWLSTAEVARVNPNTGTAPSFRTRRDAQLTMAIYECQPVWVDRSSDKPVKAWPLGYSTLFHQTNDSELFRSRSELEEQEGAWPVGGNDSDSRTGKWVPLYEGKMVQAYDHRAASVAINLNNLQRPARPQPATLDQHRDPHWEPSPRYWVCRDALPDWTAPYLLGFKDVTAATNARTMIAAMIPPYGAVNSLPLLSADGSDHLHATSASLVLANLNSVPFDFVLRQKLHGQTLNLYLIEQLPVVPLEQCEVISFGARAASDIIREAVLELTYTAHDMAAFARDLGYVDESGSVLPPFRWDEARRLSLRAKLDAAFFLLYGITNKEDVHYIYSTFTVVQKREEQAFGSYQSRDLCLAWMDALVEGKPDSNIGI